MTHHVLFEFIYRDKNRFIQVLPCNGIIFNFEYLKMNAVPFWVSPKSNVDKSYHCEADTGVYYALVELAFIITATAVL